MKKFFSVIVAFALSMCAFAQDALSVQGKVSKDGGSFDLMCQTTADLATIGAYIYFPKGITPYEVESLCELPVGFNYIASDEDGDNYIIILFNATALHQYIYTNTELVRIGKIKVNVDPDFPTGDYQAVCRNIELSSDFGTILPEDNFGNITVQKTAVIEEMPEGFGVTVSPFVAKDGDITLNFNYKSAKDIKNLSFDVELPEGMYFVDDEEWAPNNVASSLTASCTGGPTLSHQLSSGDYPTSATIKVAGAYSGKSKKYINSSSSFASLANISACVMTQQDIDDFEWNGGIMTDNLSTIKLSNIVLEDVDGNTYTGESLASVIYGKPAAQEALLYGNYDNATTDAFTSALKNVAFANTTAATFAEGALLEDVILTKDNSNITFYTRTSENYGTTVLPYDLEEASNCTLYTVKDISSESIVIEETDFVAANTPCIFKGTITAYGEFVPTLGAIDDQIVGTTRFKGTYSATSIAKGAGYYISSTDGKFYGDGASIRPFRGYFDGAVAGVKSFSVFVNTANGLVDITNQLSDEAIYSLQGIRTQTAKKGVNIVGGKKVYIK